VIPVPGRHFEVYLAPSPQGRRPARGLSRWIARRPLTAFVVLALGLCWLVLMVPVLAFHGVIPGADLPIELFALGATLVVLLPLALWVTAVTDGRPGFGLCSSGCSGGGSVSAGG
jgi:hypothetical protein